MHEYITKEHHESLRTLRNNKDIVITKPDKGTTVVIMNRGDYVKKMELILQDKSKFQALSQSKDMTKHIESQMNKLLKSIKHKSIITSEIYEEVKSIGTHIPRLYGQPKTHKMDVPLRPIMDMTDSPYHSIAMWLAKISKPLHSRLACHSSRDTFQFIDQLKDLNVPDKFMLSVDISSLFTNLPLLETVDYVCDQLVEQQIDIGLPIITVKQLLLKCTMNVQFMFNGQLFRQIDGVAMGSLSGPLLAD